MVELEFHSIECKDSKKACLECGHRTLPRILYQGKHCFCTECALALGIWEGEVDHALVERLDTILLIVEESAFGKSKFRKRRCFDGRACYCAPFEDDEPLVFQDLGDWTQADWEAWIEGGCLVWAPYIPLQITSVGDGDD
jgi:hypothetical protein